MSLSDLSDVTWLRDLLGGTRVAKLALGEHPLARGFAALRKLERGGRLTQADAIEFGNLQLTARAVRQTEAQWKPYRERLIADLLKASECMAIIFEIEVMQFSLESLASRVGWNRYEDEGNDLVLHDPTVHIECLCVRSREAEVHLNDLRSKVRQRKAAAPYIIAIGFGRDVLASEPLARWEDILRPRSVPEWDDWFGRHPEVTAALLFLPQTIDFNAPEDPKYPGQVPVKQGKLVELHNAVALHPLPAGFRFSTE